MSAVTAQRTPRSPLGESTRSHSRRASALLVGCKCERGEGERRRKEKSPSPFPPCDVRGFARKLAAGSPLPAGARNFEVRADGNRY